MMTPEAFRYILNTMRNCQLRFQYVDAEDFTKASGNSGIIEVTDSVILMYTQEEGQLRAIKRWNQDTFINIPVCFISLCKSTKMNNGICSFKQCTAQFRRDIMASCFPHQFPRTITPYTFGNSLGDFTGQEIECLVNSSKDITLNITMSRLSVKNDEFPESDDAFLVEVAEQIEAENFGQQMDTDPGVIHHSPQILSPQTTHSLPSTQDQDNHQPNSVPIENPHSPSSMQTDPANERANHEQLQDEVELLRRWNQCLQFINGDHFMRKSLQRGFIRITEDIILIYDENEGKLWAVRRTGDKKFTKIQVCFTSFCSSDQMRNGTCPVDNCTDANRTHMHNNYYVKKEHIDKGVAHERGNFTLLDLQMLLPFDYSEDTCY